MRTAHRAARVSLCIFGLIAFMLTSPVRAQGQQATLVGRALLPADTLADADRPFSSQPVGNISAILPGDYANAWLALTDSQFDKAQKKQGYLLRVYTLNVSWRDASGGD